MRVDGAVGRHGPACSHGTCGHGWRGLNLLRGCSRHCRPGAPRTGAGVAGAGKPSGASRALLGSGAQDRHSHASDGTDETGSLAEVQAGDLLCVRRAKTCL